MRRVGTTRFWARYERCVRCSAPTGGACVGLAGTKKGEPLTSPHPHRDKLGRGQHVLEVWHQDDEHVSILLDDRVLQTFNHDEHGHAGIEAAIAVAVALGRATNMRIKGTDS